MHPSRSRFQGLIHIRKCLFGASHRLYLDTPPLGGRCGAPWSAPERLFDVNNLHFPERSRALWVNKQNRGPNGTDRL